MVTLKVSMDTRTDHEYIIEEYATRGEAIKALIEWRTTFPFCHAYIAD